MVSQLVYMPQVWLEFYLQVCEVCVNSSLNVCVLQNPAVQSRLNYNNSCMKHGSILAVSNKLRLMLLPNICFKIGKHNKTTCKFGVKMHVYVSHILLPCSVYMDSQHSSSCSSAFLLHQKHSTLNIHRCLGHLNYSATWTMSSAPAATPRLAPACCRSFASLPVLGLRRPFDQSFLAWTFLARILMFEYL